MWQLYDRFSRLRKKILQSSKKDEKTESVLKIIDHAKWFEGKLIEDNSQSNLRSSVAHKQSISERLENTFQVHYLSRDQVLIYDMDSKGVPFFNTAHEMGKNLSYVTLNMLAFYSRLGKYLIPTYYNPEWKNRSVVLLSSFVNTSQD